MNQTKILEKFTNLIMKDGKKSTANKLLKKSLSKASIQLEMTEVDLLTKVMNNIKPSIDARSKKVGSTSYIIPYAITEEQSINLGLKIIVKATRERREKDFVTKLVNEFIDAVNNRGGSIKKRNEIHKLAEANKSFAFFR
jgi:small subunit ribosomal protein S7